MSRADSGRIHQSTTPCVLTAHDAGNTCQADDMETLPPAGIGATVAAVVLGLTLWWAVHRRER
jgi:hypothetical protein